MPYKLFAWVVLALGTGSGIAYSQRQPYTFFKDKIQLTDAQIQQIEQGQVVTKTLDADDKYGLLVFGAVYVSAPIAKFGGVYRDVPKLLEDKVYLAVQEFSTGGAPPKLSDFDRLSLDRKDINELQTCKAGDCDIQIFDIAATQKLVDWKSKDRYDQANKAVRQRIFEGMTQYLAGGLQALGSYQDRASALSLYQATKDMIDRSYFLPYAKAPDIYHHVIDYPKGKVAGAEDYFYWEKIDFGQEPTVRVNHVTLFPKGVGPVKYLAVNKQLYASRYIRVAVQAFYCVPDTQNPNKPGFFLIEMNASAMPDFGGIKLSVVRKVATGKATDATRNTLGLYQRRLNGLRLAQDNGAPKPHTREK